MIIRVRSVSPGLVPLQCDRPGKPKECEAGHKKRHATDEHREEMLHAISVPLLCCHKQLEEWLKGRYLCLLRIEMQVAYMLSHDMLRLREHRERLGLTLRRLGDLSGVHYVALVRLEGGKLDPRLSTLLKLCKALGITLNELVKQPGRKGAH